MKNLLLAFALLTAGSGCVLAAREGRVGKNSPCENCILISVIGTGVAEGREGRYYVPIGYTVQRFSTDGPVKLVHPHPRFLVSRKEEDGRMARFFIDVRGKDSPEFVLRDGDILFVSKRII